MITPTILHFMPEEKQLNFVSLLSHTLERTCKQNSTIYTAFQDINLFKSQLMERVSQPDISIITAHGSNNAILQSQTIGFRQVMLLSDAHLFKHNFIFAFSCFTANGFGPEAVKNDALVYIGFDQSIEDDIIYLCSGGEAISVLLQSLYREICMEAIGEAIYQFLSQCQTADKFRQNMEFLFMRKLAELGDEHPYVLASGKGIPITSEVEVALKLMPISFVNKFKSLRSKLKIIGDKHYVPWCFINNLSHSQLLEVLSNVRKMEVENEYYKLFIELLIYQAQNDIVAYDSTMINFDKALSHMAEDSIEFAPALILPKSIA